jgi:LysR family transcriptional regulator for bpeEF and oprC
VRGGQLADSTLIARRVGLLNFVTCAAPSYLERYGTPTHPRELERHRCVNYFSAKTGKIYNWDYTRDGERIDMALPGMIALNDSNAYLQAGLAGLGIIMMTEVQLHSHGTQGRLVRVVYPQNRHLSAKVRVFVEWVADLMASHPHMRLRPLATALPLELSA